VSHRHAFAYNLRGLHPGRVSFLLVDNSTLAPPTFSNRFPIASTSLQVLTVYKASVSVKCFGSVSQAITGETRGIFLTGSKATPSVDELQTVWAKPGFFFSRSLLIIVVDFGFSCMMQTFANPRMIPGRVVVPACNAYFVFRIQYTTQH
jgi:hypothetical protein